MYIFSPTVSEKNDMVLILQQFSRTTGRATSFGYVLSHGLFHMILGTFLNAFFAVLIIVIFHSTVIVIYICCMRLVCIEGNYLIWQLRACLIYIQAYRGLTCSWVPLQAQALPMARLFSLPGARPQTPTNPITLFYAKSLFLVQFLQNRMPRPCGPRALHSLSTSKVIIIISGG